MELSVKVSFIRRGDKTTIVHPTIRRDLPTANSSKIKIKRDGGGTRRGGKRGNRQHCMQAVSSLSLSLCLALHCIAREARGDNKYIFFWICFLGRGHLCFLPHIDHDLKSGKIPYIVICDEDRWVVSKSSFEKNSRFCSNFSICQCRSSDS